jgi:hypothetical protein
MTSATRARRAGRRAFGAFVERQTYKNLVYLFLAIPLGVVYYTMFGIGVLFGVVFTVVLVGLAILLATILGTRLVARFERWLANRLLDLDLREYADVDDTTGIRSRIRAYVDAPSTWRAVGFLSMKIPVAFVAVIGLILFATIASLLTAPLRYPTAVEFGEVNGEPVVWAIETIPEAALAGVVGAVLLVVFVHLANAVAYACGRMSAALLGEPTADREPPAGREPTAER